MIEKEQEIYTTFLKQAANCGSMTPLKNLDEIRKICLKYIYNSEAFVECGVAKGSCLAVMKYFSNNNKQIWGFDSFQGMPEQTEKDRIGK